MKSYWQTKKLGEICEIVYGKPFDSSQFNSAGRGTPLIRIRDITRGHSETCTTEFFEEQYRVSNGDLLIGMDGEFKVSEWTGNAACLNQRVCKLIPRKGIASSHFLLYGLNTHLKRIEDKKGFSTVKHLSAKDLNSIMFSLPPLPEQKRIVGILDAAFGKIDAVQRNAERNLANAKELFQRVLDEEMTPKEGNRPVTLKEIVSIIVGYAFKSAEYSTDSGDVKLVCGDNLEPGFFRWNVTKYWPRENISSYSKFLLKKDDVILAMDRPWIKSGLKRALVTDDILPALLLQRTACLRAPSNEISEYVYFILGTSAFSEHVLRKQTGASVPHISEKQIASFQLYIPTERRIHSVVQRMSSAYKSTKIADENYRQLLNKCAELKQQILAKAFNGEL